MNQAEYMAWLGTLTCEVGVTEAGERYRISRDADGVLVRFELWTPAGQDHGHQLYAYHRLGR